MANLHYRYIWFNRVCVSSSLVCGPSLPHIFHLQSHGEYQACRFHSDLFTHCSVQYPSEPKYGQTSSSIQPRVHTKKYNTIEKSQKHLLGTKFAEQKCYFCKLVLSRIKSAIGAELRYDVLNRLQTHTALTDWDNGCLWGPWAYLEMEKDKEQEDRVLNRVRLKSQPSRHHHLNCKSILRPF